jgi:hypothetical protein
MKEWTDGNLKSTYYGNKQQTKKCLGMKKRAKGRLG